MRFTTSPIDLKAAFAAVKSALSSNSAMPVYDNLLFRPASDGQSFSVVASDGDMTIEDPLPVVEADGLVPFLIPAARFGDYIRSLASDFPLTFKVSDREVVIEDIFCEGCDAGAFSLHSAFQVSEFPAQRPLADGYKEFTIPSETLCDALSIAPKYCANDDVRPVMNGVYADFQKSRVTVVSSNGSKLFREHISIPDTGLAEQENYGVILTRKLAAIISSTIDRTKDFTISCDGKGVCVKQGGILVHARCIEGKFPRYEVVIPRNNNRVVVINRKLLLNALRRVLIAADNSTGCVALTFDGDGRLKIEARDIDFDTKAHVSIPTDSQRDSAIRIGFRGTYLIDVLDSFRKDNEVTISMLDASRAVNVTPGEGDNRLLLIMPMQLQD